MSDQLKTLVDEISTSAFLGVFCLAVVAYQARKLANSVVRIERLIERGVGLEYFKKLASKAGVSA